MADWPIPIRTGGSEANAAACQRVLLSPRQLARASVDVRACSSGFPEPSSCTIFSGRRSELDGRGLGRAGRLGARLFESHGLLRGSRRCRARPRRDGRPLSVQSRVADAANGIIVHPDEALRLAAWHGAVGDQWRRITTAPSGAAGRTASDARRACRSPTAISSHAASASVDPAKLDHRLMSAWMGIRRSRDLHRHLVFVGEKPWRRVRAIAVAVRSTKRHRTSVSGSRICQRRHLSTLPL